MEHKKNSMGFFDSIGNIVSTVLTNQENRNMANIANKWNVEQWERANEYNKPVNQMARFQEAGLNPHLIYGQGNAGNASSVPAANIARYQAPRMDFPEVASVVGAYMNFRQMQETIGKTFYEKNTAKELYNRAFYQNLIDFGTEGGEGFIYNLDENVKNMPAWKKRQIELANMFNLNRIRDAEAGMGESLKDTNMTAADPFVARILMKAIEDTKFGKMLRRK